MIETATESPLSAAMQQPFIARPLTLTAREFAAVSTLAREEFGLELGKGKEQLVASRLGKLTRQLGFKVFRDYYRHVLGDRTGAALVELIDALTTNHTSFFREQAHFDFLIRRVLAEQTGRAPLRIWSAASSTGEEPYTIALTAREHLWAAKPVPAPHSGHRYFHPRARNRAQEECIKPIGSRKLAPALPTWLRKHLLRGEGRWKGWYRMRPEILGMVEFRRVNLIEPLPDLGRFSVIFCRNVMIYFSRETQEQLVNRLAACLDPGGYLFVGHAESLTGIRHPLQQIQPAVYRKRGGNK